MASRVYRAPMRARELDLDQFDGSRFGVENGLAGTGDRLDHAPDDLGEALLAATTEHGLKAGRMLERFADLPDGEFVWTQTGPDEYRLGRIRGPWHYDDSCPARQAGIHHVRPTEWLDEKFTASDIPEAVADTFARGGRNFQRTHDPDVDEHTAKVWERHHPG